MRYYPLGVIRLALFAGITLFYVIRIFTMNTLLGRDPHRSCLHPQQWAKTVMKVLGVKIETQGEVPDGRVLALPNHRTYLDGAVMISQLASFFVVKAEVSKWPLIGAGTYATNTIMVNREDKDNRRQTREAVKERLALGHAVTVFPEGTTAVGPGTKPFKPGMFYIAAEGQIPAMPVAIEYLHPEDAWVGDSTFVGHFLHCFSKWETPVKVRFAKPIVATDGAVLLDKTQTWINKSLIELRSEWNNSLLLVYR